MAYSDGSGAHRGVLDGGGEMGALMRSIDWQKTPLGPVEAWPQSLRTTVSTCLNSRFPICCWWGPKLVKFYNDAYVPVLGTKHPSSMGRPGAEVWPEIWHIIGPMLEGVLREGEATWSENIYLPLVRRGFEEECYFTFSYSPIRDESGGVGGVFTAVSETTGQVLGERRLRTLKDLSTHSATAKTVEEACTRLSQVLGENAADLPYTRLYLPTEDGGESRCFRTGDEPRDGAEALDRAAHGVMRDGRALRIDGSRDGAVEVGGLMIVPVGTGDPRAPRGALVVGLSPRLEFDERYRSFVELVSSQIGTALAQVAILEEAQRRADALAALDHAKTTFFSNVSHELRTPLTLILGPVQDALASSEGALRGEALETVERNAQRLLRLVNTLLDFARIEAGRERAQFAPVDLCERTAELTSAFRSAVDRAGLELEIACERLPEPIYVDVALWEKVVLNLLSNALKFTFEGKIRVGMRALPHGAELEVSDTGVGIPASDLARIFDRFHRVEGTRARTHEGSGIGLALVDEIVRMHGGTIAVRSEVNRGTTFTVTLRSGMRHLPPDQVTEAPRELRHARRTVEQFVDEALSWTPRPPRVVPLPDAADVPSRARVLVADDNADMRAYVARLLSERWDVALASDGQQALEAARAHPPDLIVTDWMMPRLDGIQLLRALRADPRLRHIPVLALSARAGEEARLDGLRAGMDDYLAKPFSAVELIGRVEAQLARMRRRAVEDASNQRLRMLLQNAPVGIALLRGPRHVFELTNARYRELIAHRDVEGQELRVALPELIDQGILELLDGVYGSGESVVGRSLRVVMNRRPDAPEEEVYFDFVYEPVREDDGQVSGILVVAFDVTELTLARREAEAANRAKDEFLAVLGHELRNPLAPILTALQLMRLRNGGADRERAIIERQVHNLVRLVDDLLDVSRLTRGKVELKKERLELRELVGEAIEMASPLLEERRHHLAVDVPEGLWIDADRSRMGQVLSNLLSNAAKYTPPGGRVEVQAGRDGDALWVSVKDNGQGISAQMLPRVFDLFAQERQPLERAAGGLGLGLAIVKSLALLHGGDVEVQSEGRGRGATFTVRLPAAGAAVRLEPRPALPEAAGARTHKALRVLVVDDNRDAAELLAEALELEGYVTRVAHDGPTALQVAAEFHPDVGLLDIGLPVMDGYELAARVRELPNARDIRLVAITGYGQSSDRQRSAAAGFNAHLVKPIGIDEVDQVIGALTSS